jgi:hypothetical protein
MLRLCFLNHSLLNIILWLLRLVISNFIYSLWFLILISTSTVLVVTYPPFDNIKLLLTSLSLYSLCFFYVLIVSYVTVSKHTKFLVALKLIIANIFSLFRTTFVCSCLNNLLIAYSLSVYSVITPL